MHIFSVERQTGTVAVALLVLVTIATTPVAAQNVGNGTVVDEPDVLRTIGDGVDVMDASYDDGILELEIRSSETQAVTVAGAPAEEGPITSRSIVIEAGDTAKIAVEAGSRSGETAATISTSEIQYWFVHDTDSVLIGGPWTAQDAQIAALAGATSVALLVLFLTVRAVTGRSDSPERIA